jgi:hypothetical protein
MKLQEYLIIALTVSEHLPTTSEFCCSEIVDNYVF